jgi:hypothetical protein
MKKLSGKATDYKGNSYVSDKSDEIFPVGNRKRSEERRVGKEC